MIPRYRNKHIVIRDGIMNLIFFMLILNLFIWSNILVYRIINYFSSQLKLFG